MPLTAEQANTLLADPKYQTPDGLLELIRQLSVETPADRPGALTLLYSARTATNNIAPSAWEVAENKRNEIIADLREALTAYKGGGVYSTRTTSDTTLDA